MNVPTVLTSIAQALCAELTASTAGPTCFCGVIPGDSVVADYSDDCSADGCGVAWTRLVTSYPAVTVGVASEQVGNCGVGLGFDVEIGVLRCINVDEGAPGEADSLDMTLRQIQDMETMRCAITKAGISGKDYMMGAYRPLGPLGGLLGGTWTIYLAL